MWLAGLSISYLLFYVVHTQYLNQAQWPCNDPKSQMSTRWWQLQLRSLEPFDRRKFWAKRPQLTVDRRIIRYHNQLHLVMGCEVGESLWSVCDPKIGFSTKHRPLKSWLGGTLHPPNNLKITGMLRLKLNLSYYKIIAHTECRETTFSGYRNLPMERQKIATHHGQTTVYIGRLE